MTGATFAKLVRDAGLLCDTLTPGECDVIFNKVKAIGERRISAKEFGRTLPLLAFARYGNDSGDACGAVLEALSASQRVLTGSFSATRGNVYDRLTDAALFTGSHKERFDEEGRGLGRAGRASPRVLRTGATTGELLAYRDEPISDLSLITRPSMRGGTHFSTSGPGRRATSKERSGSGSGSGSGGVQSPQRVILQRPQSAYVTSSSSSASASAAAPTAAASSFSGGGSGVWGGLNSSGGGSSAHASGSWGSPTAARRPATATATAAAPPSPASAGQRVVIDSPDLQAIFSAYCAFGMTSAYVPELDSSRFAKLCREGHIISRTCPPAAADVAFAKAKAKGKRTLTYSQFQQALALLAPQRYPGVEPLAALQQVVEGVIGAGGPSVTSVTMPATSGVYDMLTNAAHYTGSHKERFDPLGRGLGKEGRE